MSIGCQLDDADTEKDLLNQRAIFHLSCHLTRARRAGGAGEDPVDDQLQDVDGAGQAPGSSWYGPSTWSLPLWWPRALGGGASASHHSSSPD